MPFCYKHPDYWHVVIEKETKRTGDMINSRKLFDDSETAHPITEDEMIKIEKIHGTLLLIGAEDDVLWDTAKYIRRMELRMKEHPYTCRLESVIYEHATHFVFPESMLKTMLHFQKHKFFLFFESGNYVKECLCLIDTHLVGELFFRFHNMILPSAQMKKYGGRGSFLIAKTAPFSLETGISHSLRLYF